MAYYDYDNKQERKLTKPTSYDNPPKVIDLTVILSSISW